jgi:FtsP/CotA-like multicopper oxidase with cupredoxin domain
MSRTARIILTLGAVVAVAIAGFVVLRPSDDEPTTASDAPQATQTATTQTPATTTTEARKPKPRPKATLVRVSGGQPVGGVKTIEKRQGQTVRLTVSSDAADEVHVHGFDIEKPVGPGEPARFVFAADIQGRYEVELHGSGTQIAQIDVTP